MRREKVDLQSSSTQDGSDISNLQSVNLNKFWIQIKCKEFEKDKFCETLEDTFDSVYNAVYDECNLCFYNLQEKVFDKKLLY